MEIACDLQFKHYTVAEAQLPADALRHIAHVSLDELELCCDLDHHVFNPQHTDPEVCSALRASHWFDVHEWATAGPGTDASLPTVDSDLPSIESSDTPHAA
jgi:hypothetical protein